MIKNKVNCCRIVFVQFFIFLTLLFLSLDYVQAQTTLISNPYQSVVSLTNNTAQNNSLGITCVDLSYDLYQGLSDSSKDKSVYNLQNYLLKLGYLRVSPNGYFGPSTLSAVKNYQLNNNISNTGRVGPATRKKIKDDSCKIDNTASVINALPSTTPKPNRINSSNLTVSYPAEDSIHKTDTKIKIRWSGNSNNIYDLILEDKDGVGVGHITSSVSGNVYEWTVGKVYSARTNSEVVVEPGLYRIRLTSSGSSSVSEQYSGLFTIQGKPLEINSIMPNTIQNNENSSIVIYGKGFDETTKVNFDVMNSGRIVKPVFVSSDGKIIVFQANSFITPGQYWITVNNQYNSGATSTPSNSVSLLIKE